MLLVLAALTAGRAAPAQDNYSRPVSMAPQPDDIGAAYQPPDVQRTPPRAAWLYLFDVVLLAASLVLAAVIVHLWRRRWMMVALSLASLAYFGFNRQGCVCPIGATQNVAAAIADPALAVPLAVLLFFLLPLIAALAVGRVFCAGVCPLGAIQDLVLLRPVELPRAVDRWGGMVKYLYLAAAIWFAVQPGPAQDFIICRFDPFVGFFRLSGAAWMLTLGGVLLAIGTVIGRPYCRFLCPYGGLLAIVSRMAFKSVRITPDDELDCGLCAQSCPFGAIHNLRADRADCLACTRCYGDCPRQRYQWGEITLVELPTPPAAKKSPRPDLAEAVR